MFVKPQTRSTRFKTERFLSLPHLHWDFLYNYEISCSCFDSRACLLVTPLRYDSLLPPFRVKADWLWQYSPQRAVCAWSSQESPKSGDFPVDKYKSMCRACLLSHNFPFLPPSQALETKLSRTCSSRKSFYSLQFYINTVSKLPIFQKLLVQNKVKWKWVFLQILSASCCQLKLWLSLFTAMSQFNHSITFSQILEWLWPTRHKSTWL